eukprot:gene757-801_t
MGTNVNAIRIRAPGGQRLDGDIKYVYARAQVPSSPRYVLYARGNTGHLGGLDGDVEDFHYRGMEEFEQAPIGTEEAKPEFVEFTHLPLAIPVATRASRPTTAIDPLAEPTSENIVVRNVDLDGDADADLFVLYGLNNRASAYAITAWVDVDGDGDGDIFVAEPAGQDAFANVDTLKPVVFDVKNRLVTAVSDLQIPVYSPGSPIAYFPTAARGSTGQAEDAREGCVGAYVPPGQPCPQQPSRDMFDSHGFRQ